MKFNYSSWYERAREKAWKKFGGRFYTPTQTKRVYPKQGLLGYKVLIDGYNNTFEVPSDQLHRVRSSGITRSDKTDLYVGYSDEEREKIIQMKTFIKQFALDERQRAKQIAATHLQQSRRPPLLSRRTSTDISRHRTSTDVSRHRTSTDIPKQQTATITKQILEAISSSEFANSQILSSVIDLDPKVCKATVDTDNPSNTNILLTELNNPIRTESKLLKNLLILYLMIMKFRYS